MLIFVQVRHQDRGNERIVAGRFYEVLADSVEQVHINTTYRSLTTRGTSVMQLQHVPIAGKLFTHIQNACSKDPSIFKYL